LCAGCGRLDIRTGCCGGETIRELAETTERVLVFDASRRDGTPRKLMEMTKLHGLGWRHKTELEQGIARTWELVRNQFV